MPSLDALIEQFLVNHRECSAGGGWAQITDADLDQLHKIIWKLIELKCDRDADGDLPIQFKIVNRRTHENLAYSAVPHREGRDENGNEIELVPFTEILRILSLNLHIASERLDTEIRCEQLRN